MLKSKLNHLMHHSSSDQAAEQPQPTQQQPQQQPQHAAAPQQQPQQNGPILILSVDGGGVRGLASVQFLAHLEKALGKPLVQVFDLFAGTSVGSIITATIACKQSPIDEAATFFTEKTIQSIMDASIKDKTLGVAQPTPKYDGKGKTKFLDSYFADLVLQNAAKPIVLTSYDIEKRELFLMRSTQPDTEGKTIKVADACNGSSAAPAYFPAEKVNSRWVIDGGVVANCPAMVAYAESCSLFGRTRPVFMVSVGTGGQIRPLNGEKAQGWGGLQWLAHGLLDIAMDETPVEFQTSMILGDNLVRINSDLEKANDDMDDTSSSNLQALRELGDMWWDRFGERTVALIRQAGKA